MPRVNEKEFMTTCFCGHCAHHLHLFRDDDDWGTTADLFNLTVCDHLHLSFWKRLKGALAFMKGKPWGDIYLTSEDLKEMSDYARDKVSPPKPKK